MGTFTSLELGGRKIYESTNSFYYDLVKILFSEQDLIKEMMIGEDYYSFFGFKQNVKNCLDRLGIIGVNDSKAEEAFILAKDRLSVVEFEHFNISYEEYKDAIRKIIKTNYQADGSFYLSIYDDLADNLTMPNYNISYALYTILKIIGDDKIVTYDLTDIVNSGWVTETEIYSSLPEKILLLTEGKTDTEFIQHSLKRLYPHLIDHYQFLNFDEYKPDANASYLAKFIISLSAANFKHPIIAIFDNDTTGISEMRRLEKIKLGDNMRVLHYPDLKLARNYPTIGPTGFHEFDINGYACSIELYFGERILGSTGQLVPVTWNGYNEKEKKYQGEITNKSLIQKLFRDHTQMGYDCGDMDLILKTIFTAYH